MMESLADTMAFIGKAEAEEEDGSIVSQESARAAEEAGLSPSLVYWLQQVRMFEQAIVASSLSANTAAAAVGVRRMRTDAAAARAKAEVEVLQSLRGVYRLLD